MDWLTFVATLVQALAWPALVVLAVVLLRDPLTRLLPTLRSAKYKDLEFQFGEKLGELGDVATQAKLPERELPADWVYRDPDEFTFRHYIERLAPISPRAAIAEAWRGVEVAFTDAAQREGIPEGRPLTQIVRGLEARGSLPRDALPLVDDLRILRNRAVHAEDFEPEPAQAVEFGHLAERLMASVQPDVLEEAEREGRYDTGP